MSTTEIDTKRFASFGKKKTELCVLGRGVSVGIGGVWSSVDRFCGFEIKREYIVCIPILFLGSERNRIPDTRTRICSYENRVSMVSLVPSAIEVSNSSACVVT